MLRRNARGSVSLIGVFALVALIGIAALSIELGQGYRAKLAMQGAADAAALAAAHAYAAAPSETMLTATAQDVARANSVPASGVRVVHRPNYSSTVADAVEVTLRTTIPLYFARIFSRAASYGVSVSAVASLPSESTPPCLLALAPSGGIALSGGTSLSAPDCAAVSNSSISVSGGSTLTARSTMSSGASSATGGSKYTAETITYGTSASGVTGKTVQQANSTSDPLANDAVLQAAFARLGQRTVPVTKAVPAGDDLTLGYYPTTMTFQGRTGTMSDNVWRFPAGSYAIRTLNTGSLTLRIDGPSTITVSNGVKVGGGGGLVLGDGSVTIKGTTTLGGPMTMGKGRHIFGPLQIGGGGMVRVGDGDLDVSGAILVSGGADVRFGAGAHAIGNDGAGKAIDLGGGSRLAFGDGPFSADGSIVTAGGTALTFGATANHYINGNLDLRGSSVFGAGTYLANGSFANGTGGEMVGQGVSFVLAGSLKLSGGTTMNVAAPGSGAAIGLPEILFATRSTAATTLGGGAKAVLSGIVYAPNSDIVMSGGTSAADGGGACFSLVARTIALNGGPSLASACQRMGNGGVAGGVGLIR